MGKQLDKESALDSIVRVAQKTEKELKDAAGGAGVTLAEAEALVAVKQFGGERPSLSDIARATRSMSLPSRLMKDLRNRELVDQATDPSDERMKRYQLTKEGESIVQRILAEKKRIAAQTMKNLNKHEESSLASIVAKLG